MISGYFSAYVSSIIALKLSIIESFKTKKITDTFVILEQGCYLAHSLCTFAFSCETSPQYHIYASHYSSHMTSARTTW